MRIKACVLTYREIEMASRCLASISGVDEAEVFFNGSDGEAEKDFGIPDVTVLSSAENLAFAEVVNRAIERADGFDLLLFVTNDVTFQQGAIEHLIHGMEDGVGLCGPIQMEPDMRTVHHGGGGFKRKEWKAEVENDLQAIDGLDRQWIDGGAMMIRVSAVMEVGLLRPEFGFYWEDVDWGLRFVEKGWKVRINPAAVVTHEKSPTTGKFGKWKKYMIARNRALSARLHLKGKEFDQVSAYLKRSAFFKVVKKFFREDSLIYRAAIRDGLTGNYEYMNQPIADDDPRWRDVL